MTPIATGRVNWSELWKIILTALVGGTGVVIVFGLLLLGISRGKTATKPATRYGLYTLSGLCGVLVVAVAAVGVYAITQKPSPAKPNQSSGSQARPSRRPAATDRLDYVHRARDAGEVEHAGGDARDRCNETAYALISTGARRSRQHEGDHEGSETNLPDTGSRQEQKRGSDCPD